MTVVLLGHSSHVFFNATTEMRTFEQLWLCAWFALVLAKWTEKCVVVGGCPLDMKQVAVEGTVDGRNPALRDPGRMISLQIPTRPWFPSAGFRPSTAPPMSAMVQSSSSPLAPEGLEGGGGRARSGARGGAESSRSRRRTRTQGSPRAVSQVSAEALRLCYLLVLFGKRRGVGGGSYEQLLAAGMFQL